jgi:hypothetical protein
MDTPVLATHDSMRDGHTCIAVSSRLQFAGGLKTLWTGTALHVKQYTLLRITVLHQAVRRPSLLLRWALIRYAQD